MLTLALPARARLLPLAAALSAAFATSLAGAASFTVNSGVINTTPQTLKVSETGTVNGTLSVGDTASSTGNIAVTIKGNNATLNNNGTIVTTGTGRVVRDNTGVTGLLVNNNAGAVMQSADADVIQMNVATASVTLNNRGSMTSLNASKAGSQAVDFNAITSGSNVVNNYAGALLKAFEADAVRPGVNGVVNNAGKIWSVTTTGSSSDGIDGQTNSGIQITNSGLVEGGRHGITGGAASASVIYTMSVVNALGGVIQGDNGSGINLDGFNGNQKVDVENHGTIVGNGITGDGDGVDVDGLVTLINTGVIRSLNAVPESTDPVGSVAFSEGLSVGGGSITNYGGTISGEVAAGNTSAKGIGITLTGNDQQVGGKDTGLRDGIYGNATVVNQNGGLITGQNSSAIVVKGEPNKLDFTVSISNDATSTIRGGGTTDAAIQLGNEAVTINNSGKIDGSSSHVAIAGGAGNLTVNVTGGQAQILGNIVGGTGHNVLTIDAGAGNSFAYSSGISNFDKVDVASGTTTLSGVSTYTGTTEIDAGAKLVLDGANRLAAGSKLDLEGGKLAIVDAGGANGQEFAVLTVGKDSAIDLGGSSITVDALGNVVTGKLSVADWLQSTSPSYALRFAGDLTHDSAFLALMGDTTVDGLAAMYHYDGHFTDVTAVPEPANAALLLAGLGLLGAAARRRRQA